MTRIFYGFMVIGAVLVIALAAVFPLPQNQRYASSTNVIPDGGRGETFVVQWPQDRIQPLATDATGLVAAGGAVLMPAAGTVAASAELFRLRDAAGNIVGIASRSVAPRGNASGSDWILLVPSRGTLFMTQADSRDMRARAAGPLAEDPAFWSGVTRVRVSAGPTAEGAGQILGGTDEFEGLRGSYDETWELEKIDGEVARGRILLETRVVAAQ